MSEVPYDPAYFDGIDNDARTSASGVVPLVLEFVEPASVVDVGCGLGAWLATFAEHGVTDVAGVDGPWVPRGLLAISTDHFTEADLEIGFPDLNRRFDLAVSLEVAEHLSADRAADFVAYLTRLTDVVLFSAAIPGQRGRDHRNEQWPGYWGTLFAEHGFIAVDALRPRIWEMDEVAWWYRQNVLFFVSPSALARHPNLQPWVAEGTPHALVHPDCFDRERQDRTEAEEHVTHYREWVALLKDEQSALRQKSDHQAEELERMQTLQPGALSLRAILRALPRLTVHALQARRRVRLR